MEMARMRIKIVGCGDAFGSGGRRNTCFHIEAGGTRFLVDCGASSLPALKAEGIDRNAIDFIFLTHFHGDHAGGVPFFVLDAQLVARRMAPLVIAGPPGLGSWYERAMEAAFAGSSRVKRKFEVVLRELTPRELAAFGPVRITPYPVVHGQPEGSFFAYRIECGGRVLAYSGDTEWVETLVDAGRDADLLIAEAYFFDKQVPFHLDYKTLAAKLTRIGAKRVLLTHMSEDMLARASDAAEETAEDGLVIDL
jgi:ribonuclease BN (tRNA processing enzyme)